MCQSFLQLVSGFHVFGETVGLPTYFGRVWCGTLDCKSVASVENSIIRCELVLDGFDGRSLLCIDNHSSNVC